MVYVNKSDIYKLFDESNGIIKLHIADVDMLPTADVEEVKHGYWRFVNQATNYLEAPCGDTCHCSICGFSIDVSETHFKRCPNCGAKMDERKENNDNNRRMETRA